MAPASPPTRVRSLIALALFACYDPDLSDKADGSGGSQPDASGRDAIGPEARPADAPVVADASGDPYLCDAPGDCPGQECCVNALPGAGSSCQDDCPGGTAEVCETQDDCDCGTCDSCGDDPDPKVPNYPLPVCYDN